MLINVLIRKKRGKIFGSRKDEMFRSVQNVAESIYQNYCRNYPEIAYNHFPYFKLVIVHFRVEEISCYFFRPHFYKIFKAKKNNGSEMSFLKYESRNEMLIYCFTCRNFIRSFFYNLKPLPETYFNEAKIILIQFILPSC